MNLSAITIKRPVLAIVLSLILVVIGLVGYTDLDTRFFPKFEQNIINITTFYTGASAALVESSITTPIETAISGIPGVDTIESQSYQGQSIITLTLSASAHIDEVSNQIRDRVELARHQLPTEVDAPKVQAGFGDIELMDIGFINPNQDVYEIRDYLERYVINRIEQIPGIASVDVVGANKYAMRISLDPEKMNARGISVNDVTHAIQSSNIELPAGEIKGNRINYPITAKTKLVSATEFNNLVVKIVDNNLVRIKDIGSASLGSDSNDDSIVKINGQPGIFLSIHNATDANPMKAAEDVNQFLHRLAPQLPTGMSVVPSFDISQYMNESVHEVYLSIFFAIICVVIVIFLFLGDWRSVLVPIATIPVCVLATFGVMYFCHFSINVITLLALVLSIGLVVDDAIVMLENIYRHLQQGESPFLAAINGSKEIAFAVIAMTITLAAVYAPIGLLKNQAAIIFQSFAFTLAGAVIISGFVALTLSPMMCARLLKTRPKNDKSYYQFIESWYHRLAEQYGKILSRILQKKRWVVLFAILIACSGYGLIRHIPMAFVPNEDMGLIIASLSSKSGTSIDTYGQELQQLAAIFSKYPEVNSSIAVADTNARSENGVFATLKPYKERKSSAEAIAAKVTADIQKIPGLNASAFAPSFGGSMQFALTFSLMGADNYDQLYQLSQKIIDQLKNYPGISKIESNVKFDTQQYTMTVNRDLAAKLQVNINDIDNTIATFLGGSHVSDFDQAGQTYPVYVQANSNVQNSLNNINQFYVRNQINQLIPMTNLIHMEPALGQMVLSHFNRLRAAEISAQLAPGYQLGTVVQYLQNTLPTILPSNLQYAFTGAASNLLSSNSSMGIIFLLALVFIYLVLAAQFESFIDPFIILLAVPLSVVGALLSLKMIGGTLNIYTDIGLVTLIGLVSKHGILITQFANTLQAEGAEMMHAIIQSAQSRLRPILMTTAAMIVGALPLLFTGGASGESRRQIAIVIMGGLFFGTFFSLVVVPVAYCFANRIKARFFNRRVSTITS